MAAARYIKDIYATDAQASGLLVMASYNWGEQRVINLLRTMPAQSAGAQFLEAPREARNGPGSNLQVRVLHRCRPR